MIARFRTLAVASTAALLLATIVAGSGTTTVTAQTTRAEWAFAPRGVFGDQRAVQSMRLQMDADAAAAAGGVSLAYLGNAELFAPPEDALIVLMAAGILGHEEDQVTGIAATRACRVWSGGADGAEADALAATAGVLASELARVWGDLGVVFAPCETTQDPTTADLLVFPAGSPPVEVDFVAFDMEGSFFGFTPPPGAIPSGTGGDDVVTPIPAQGGSLGPVTSHGEALAWLTAVAAVMLVVAARTVTRPDGRSTR